ncbi:MAG TPA: DUF4402 domain-containing protein [Sphingomicrobium sp.]|nr:DUF4402 domain-containing protein [Sphingomicrobium sp.]
MGTLKVQALMLAALAATAATPVPAGAQCRLCSAPVTSHDDSAPRQDVRIEVQSSINFDRLVLLGDGNGAATIRPDGSHAAEGAVGEVGGRAMVGSATVHGEPGRAVRVELPSRVELYSLSGGRISFDEVISDLPSLPRLDSAGNLSFRFGGRIKVTGDAGGEYRGDLPITVEYQ